MSDLTRDDMDEDAQATKGSAPGQGKSALVVDNLTRQFGGLKAVDVDHLAFEKDKITALIGPNGAGKTTFFNLISGFDQPDSGTWKFGDQEMSSLEAHEVARLGLIRTFQLTKALSRLSVLQNMMLGATGQQGESLWASVLPFIWSRQEKANRLRALELLERFKLDHLQDEFAANLSGGQKKLLEMARALMADPAILLLDEPMAGVNPALTQTLLGHIKDIRDQGRTVIFVEHDMDVVRDISDWVVVMAEGKIVSQGRHAEIVSDPKVVGAYLGGHHGVDFSDMDISSDDPADDAPADGDLVDDEPADDAIDDVEASNDPKSKADKDE